MNIAEVNKRLKPIFEKIASYGNYLFDELKKTKQNRKD